MSARSAIRCTRRPKHPRPRPDVFTLALTLLKALPVVGGIFKMLFPSPEERLGKAEQALKDIAATDAAEKVKNETPVPTAHSADDSLRSGDF